MQLSIATVVVLVLGLATGFHLLIRVNHLEDVMARLKVSRLLRCCSSVGFR
jgi:hypothetical protein